MIFLLTIFSAGLIVLGSWLWLHRVGRIRSSATNLRGAVDPQEKADLAEGKPFSGTGMDEGVKKKVPQESEGKQILSDEPNGNGESKTMADFDSEIQQASLSVAIEDEEDISAVDAESESLQENLKEVPQASSGSPSCGLEERMEEHAEWQSQASFEEISDKSDARRKKDDKDKGEENERTAIDESVGGSERVKPSVTTTRVLTSWQENPGTVIGTNDQPVGEATSVDVLGSNDAHSGYANSREHTENKKAWSEPEADYKQQGKGVLRTDGENGQKAGRKKTQIAVYRDRRGLRRAVGKKSGKNSDRPSPPAEARFRLMLDPVQRNADLSVVPMRPEGFPERIRLLLDDKDPVEIEAFDSGRYDDLLVTWTGDLLNEELRIKSEENQQWLRSARVVHIFSEDPAEPGMISVGSVQTNVAHAIVCKTDDEDAIRDMVAETGSPPLVSHKRWRGIPNGWTVLSGYCPRHAAETALPTQFSPLDPGIEVEILLTGGLPIRATAYAEGHPPRICIASLPDVATVLIGGVSAKQATDGTWEADGWDSPGHHLVDVVPGPSLTYYIIADPLMNGECQLWDAHPERFGPESDKPWSRARICGATVRGPDGETVMAAARLPILIALGKKRQAVRLMPRSDVPASVAMISEAPSFLVAATGLRRNQGRIVWMGSTAKKGGRAKPDQQWAQTVREIAARRLCLDGADADGERVWLKAKQRARRIWRKR